MLSQEVSSRAKDTSLTLCNYYRLMQCKVGPDSIHSFLIFKNAYLWQYRTEEQYVLFISILKSTEELRMSSYFCVEICGYIYTKV